MFKFFNKTLHQLIFLILSCFLIGGAAYATVLVFVEPMPSIPPIIYAEQTITPVVYTIKNNYSKNLPIKDHILNAQGQVDNSGIIQRIHQGQPGNCGSSLAVGASCQLQYSINAPAVSSEQVFNFTLSIDYDMREGPISSKISFTVVPTEYVWSGISPFSTTNDFLNFDSSLYTATNNGVYVLSADEGWGAVGSHGDLGNSSVLLEFNNNLYSNSSATVYELVDDTWLAIGGGNLPDSSTQIYSLIEFENTLFAGTDAGVYQLQSDVWVAVGDLFNDAGNGQANTLAVFNNQLYVGTNGAGVYQFTGTEWTEVGGPTGGSTIYTLEVLNAVLTAGTNGGPSATGVYQLIAGSWAPVGDLEENVTSLLLYEGLLTAGTDVDGVFQFDGTSWSALGNSIPGNGDVLSLIIFDNTLHAGLNDLGVYELIDTDWVIVNLEAPGNGFIQQLIEWNGALYAATYGTGVYQQDLTQTPPAWIAIGNFDDANVVDIVVFNNTLYASVDESTDFVAGIYYYDPIGDQWNLVPTSGFPNDIAGTTLFVFNEELYSGTEFPGAVYRLIPEDASWEKVGTNELDNDTVLTMTDFNGNLYVAGHYVYVLMNNTWQQVGGSQMPWLQSVYSLLEYGNILYAGTSSGVYKLVGPQWQLAGIGMDPSVPVTYSLTEFDGSLFAGTGAVAPQHGGAVFELVGNQWIHAASNPGGFKAVFSLLPFNGLLNAGAFGNGLWVRDQVALP